MNVSAQCCPERMSSEDTPSDAGSMKDQGIDSPLGWTWNMEKESKLTKSTEAFQNNKLAF